MVQIMNGIPSLALKEVRHCIEIDALRYHQRSIKRLITQLLAIDPVGSLELKWSLRRRLNFMMI